MGMNDNENWSDRSDQNKKSELNWQNNDQSVRPLRMRRIEQTESTIDLTEHTWICQTKQNRQVLGNVPTDERILIRNIWGVDERNSSIINVRYKC